MKTQQRITMLLIVSALCACGESANYNTTENAFTSESSKVITSTPHVLRSIAIDDISANISVSGIEKRVIGSDFPNGEWLVDLPLTPNQSHSLLIEWYAGTHLVLEEFGEFFADPNNRTIKPTLDYISGGYARFDADCDNLSNLDELIRGTDLTIAQGLTTTECAIDDAASEPPALEPDNYPYVVKQLRNFAAGGYEQRVVRYEQRVQVRSTNLNARSDYSVTLVSEGQFNTATKAKIEFTNHLEKGRLVRFEITNATAAIADDASNSDCFSFGTDNVGYACNINFDWQENQWYIIAVEEIATDQWHATIKSVLGTTEQTIATITANEGTDWQRAQMSLSYAEPVGPDSCQLGLPAIGMRFTTGVINSERTLLPNILIKSPCAQAREGTSEGVRTLEGELVYELILGGSL